MIYHKNPVEESFIVWITFNPDSFHHLDMNRFYVFVRSVVCYNAKSWQRYKKFKSEILRHKPNFKEEDIEYFHNLMNHMISFYKSSYIPRCESDEYCKTTVRKVVNGKIIIEDLQE